MGKLLQKFFIVVMAHCTSMALKTTIKKYFCEKYKLPSYRLPHLPIKTIFYSVRFEIMQFAMEIN